MPRLYLCDDARDYRTLLKAVLTAEEGLQVVGEGGDAGFCLEDAARHDPDVILLDVNMPGLNGIEALPQLREVLPDSRVIMLTSASSAQSERAALEAGAHGFIQKPTNILDLPQIIRGKLLEAGIDL